MLDAQMAEKKRINVVVTEDQHRVIQRAINRDKSSNSISALIRQWLADYVEKQGIEWPDEDLSWGGRK